ncbi:MAG: protease pro-enzyme activation domain-containing protein [Steroidobacteraceae bacterium]
MKTSKSRSSFTFFAGLLMLAVLPGALAAASAPRVAVPYPTAMTPKAVALGPLEALSSDTPIAFTIALRLPDLEAAEKLLQSVSTPGDPQYHQFLTAAQFVARFAPTKAEVARVIAALGKYGLSAEQTTATTLRVSGRTADIERAFSVSLHSYEVPAHDNAPSYTFHAPLTHATIPAEISDSVAAVVGLDSRPSLRPLHRTVSSNLKMVSSVPQTKTPDQPGFWTVTDFADYYHVQPLYHRGVTGSGRTIGIVTFASFTPSDAYAYWTALGLSVDPNRIKIVNVDGGPGAPSDVSGSDETTIDVEQSGGIAPGARIIVYQGQNTGQGLDTFAAAIDANSAETISVSWGEWEECANRGIGNTTSACVPPDLSYVHALHELFVRAAIQGQTFFAASGDNGAYAADEFTGCYPTGPSGSCSLVLSVLYPASDSAMTAAGGTTLPGLQEYCLNTACTPPFYDINIPHERVWGWDYLIGYCSVLGYDPITCGIFAAGSGGGVSVAFAKPLYQFFLPGTQFSQPGQSWIVNGELVYALPAYFPGRNVPDISFNADPDTGYVIYYTSSATGFGIQSFWGGTSFVAPQLNGVSALLGEDLHSRLGLLNYPLYLLGLTGEGYRGPRAPFRAIPYGDNWFYHGSNGYNPAVGLGTLDVANFAEFLQGVW